MTFMRTYIAPITMALLISTTDLSAAAACGAGGTSAAHDHDHARAAIDPETGWNDLKLAGVFQSIDLTKIPEVMDRVYDIDNTNVQQAFFMLQEPVSDADAQAQLRGVLARLRHGEEAIAYFTKERVADIAASCPRDAAADAIQAIAFTEIDRNLTAESAGILKANLTRCDFLRYLNDAVIKRNETYAHSTGASLPYLQAQIAYCLVCQVALGDQAVEMQKGMYYAPTLLKPEDLNPARNALWNIFLETGFVTSTIAKDAIDSFVYNPAEALRDHLASNPGQREIVLGCGSLPKIYQETARLYGTGVYQFFPSLSFHDQHHNQVTISLDPRERPSIFANVEHPGLFSLVPAERLDKIIVEGGRPGAEAIPVMLETLSAGGETTGLLA